MQSRFKISVLSLNIDLHVFANSDAAHLRHSQMSHRITNRVALRVEHRRFWHHDHLCLHLRTIFAAGRADKRNPPETPFIPNLVASKDHVERAVPAPRVMVPSCPSRRPSAPTPH